MRTITGRSDHVVVVGAGLAGLAAALHLAGRGPRGHASSNAAPTQGAGPGGWTSAATGFDTGPTVLTMPDLLAEPLAAVGEELTDRLDLVRLDPAYRAAFADGSTLDVHTDAQAMTDAVEAFAGPAEAAGYQRLRAWLTELYQREFSQFIAANFDSPLSLVTPSLARLTALGAFRRLEPAIGRFIQRRAAAAGVLVPVPVRGGVAQPRAGRLRGHRLHGHRGRGVLPARRHARGAGRAGRRGRQRRGEAALRRRPSPRWNDPGTGSRPSAPSAGCGSRATRWCWPPS